MEIYHITAEQLRSKYRDIEYPGVDLPGDYTYDEKRNRYFPVPTKNAENPHDFSSSGLGIGGLGAQNTAAYEIEMIEARCRYEEKRQLDIDSGRMKKCRCGHWCEPVLVMSTSSGSSCPDCYDRMSE
jgi:hypothetical protein